MIAVLGAGLQGCLCALELADRGEQVLLVDRREDALLEASLHNEGKIHIGYVYANDRVTRTASMMARGAAEFVPLMSRWWCLDEIESTASDPFEYVVMKDSIVSADQLVSRYAAIDDVFGHALSGTCSYFGTKSPNRARTVDRQDWGQRYNPEHVVEVFSTTERSISLPLMARAIRDAVRNHPRIETAFETQVTGVESVARSGWRIVTDDGAKSGPFRHVINALWGDRLRIDATLGIVSTRPFLMRRKVANRLITQGDVTGPGSATLVLGPYGDIVRYPDGSYYLSWYPIGCIDQCTTVDLPQSWSHLPDAGWMEDVLTASVRALDQRIEGIAALVDRATSKQSVPGIIFAWGAQDIDHPESTLHQRFDVGPRTHFGTYHSVDTGKLTLAPVFARTLADRICPR